MLELPLEHFVPSLKPPSNGSFFRGIFDIIHRTFKQVVGDNSANPRPYQPFGFKNTGALVVEYSNTPANTLPIIQHESNTWNALFPRSARIK